MASGLKYLGKSKYKYVSKIESAGKVYWRGRIFDTGKSFKTEREAAIYVDKKLIEKFKEPVNILVRK
jgi:hypothetical protein